MYFSHLFEIGGLESELWEQTWRPIQKEFMVEGLFTAIAPQRTPVSESQKKIISAFLESYEEEMNELILKRLKREEREHEKLILMSKINQKELGLNKQKEFAQIEASTAPIEASTEQIRQELRIVFEADNIEKNRSSIEQLNENWNWISRSDLFEKAGLKCSNSRFSQILGGMEGEGFIQRSYDRDAEGVVSVSVALREAALELFPNLTEEEEAAEIAGQFN
jgi:ferritin-like protein